MVTSFTIMSDHICRFKRSHGGDIFKCVECGLKHVCGVSHCEYLYYNKDQTQVCSLTGRCFQQRMCDTFSDFSKGLDNGDPVYLKRVKRDQQLKNRSISVDYILKLLDSLEAYKADMNKRSKLASSIIALWSEYVQTTKILKKYTHRNDKRSFVVSIVKYMEDGIVSNNGDYIVFPHKDFRSKKLNKKSRYTDFKVSDVRKGFNLLKSVFVNKEVKNPILIK